MLCFGSIFLVYLISHLAFAADVIYDYVIAGGGSTGLLLAVALTSNPNVTVAVLEAGGDARTDTRVTVPENEGAITGTKYDWAFHSVPQSHLYQNASISIPMGKVIGGSGAMNFMIWHRASAVEFDSYQNILQIPGWNWSTIYAANKASETFYNPPASQANITTYNDAYHGMSGPIHGTMEKSVFSLYPDYVIPSLKSISVPIPQDTDGGNTTGARFVPLAIDPASYTRSYSGSAYTAVQNRKNLHVFVNLTVSQILWSSSSTSPSAIASALQYYNTTNGKQVVGHINASQIIISAGAIKSPQLLELSGIGNPSIMNPLGIKTVVNLPAVGTQFQDHPNYVGDFSFNKSSFTGGQYAQDFQDYAPASRFLSPADHSTLASMLQPSTAPAGISQPSWSMLKQMFLTDQPLIEYGWYFGYTTTYLLHPLSTGTVHINSSNPLANPRIDPAYNSALVNNTSIDLWLLAKATQYYATVLPATAPLDSIAAQYSLNANQSFSAFQAQVLQGVSSGSHFTGGAPLLPKASGGVVDQNLLVYGTRNVRVVDCSIVPVSPGQHTMGLAYAVAMMAAKILGADGG